MKQLLAAVTFLGFSCIACAPAFAGFGMFHRPSDLAASMLTSATVGDGVAGDSFDASALTDGAPRDLMDDNQHDTRIVGTFVGKSRLVCGPAVPLRAGAGASRSKQVHHGRDVPAPAAPGGRVHARPRSPGGWSRRPPRMSSTTGARSRACRSALRPIAALSGAPPLPARRIASMPLGLPSLTPRAFATANSTWRSPRAPAAPPAPLMPRVESLAFSARGCAT